MATTGISPAPQAASPTPSPAPRSVAVPVPSLAPGRDGQPATRATIIEVRPAAAQGPALTAPDGTAPVVVLACLLLFLCGLAAWLLAHHAHQHAPHPARHPEGSRAPAGPATRRSDAGTQVGAEGNAPAGAP